MTAEPMRKLKYAVSLVQNKKQYEPGDGGYVGLEHIRSWTGEMDNSAESTPEGTVSLFERGDILFGKLRPYLAKVALATSAGAASTEALVLRTRNDVWPPYLRYVLAEKGFIDRVTASTFGAQMPRASWEFIGSQLVPLPNLPTQRAIADFLGRETDRIDRLIEKKERLTSLVDENRRTTIIAAVTGHLDRPEDRSQIDSNGPTHQSPFPGSLVGWNRTRLRYCIESAKNGAWGTDEGTDERDVICLRVADFSWDTLSVSLDKLTTRSVSLDQFRRLALRSGDILLEKSGGGDKTPVGRVVRYDHDMDAITSNFVARVRPAPTVDSHFLTYLLAGLYMAGYSHQFIKQNTGIQNLDDAALFDTTVSIPNLNEQQSIVDLLKREADRVEALQRSIRMSLDRLRELRSALITAAVTGQIDPATWGRRGETDRRLEAIERGMDPDRETEPAGATA